MTEADRLAAVEATGLVGQDGGQRLQRVVRHASEQLGAPMALISLVGQDRQWHPAVHGDLPRAIDRVDSLCSVAIERGDTLVVPDLAADPAWASRPVQTAGGRVRFYAGQPLRDAAGLALGTLCVLDVAPRHPSDQDLRALCELAEWAQLELAAMHVAEALESGRRGAARADELGGLQDLLIAATAHDLRTPITVVRAHAELLASDPAVQGAQRASVEAILAAALELQARSEAVVRSLREHAGGAEDALRARLDLERGSGGQGTGR